MRVRAGVKSFQFLIVRLKFRTATARNTSKRFQFLIVRLKFRRFTPITTVIPRFQFLIVRLKSEQVKPMTGKTAVSIPYSTIKI